MWLTKASVCMSFAYNSVSAVKFFCLDFSFLRFINAFVKDLEEEVEEEEEWISGAFSFFEVYLFFFFSFVWFTNSSEWISGAYIVFALLSTVSIIFCVPLDFIFGGFFDYELLSTESTTILYVCLVFNNLLFSV